MRYVPTLSECQQLASFETEGDAATVMFNAAIAVLYATGFKAVEAIGLTWDDRTRWDNDRMILEIRGDNARSIPVQEAATLALRRHELLSPPERSSDPMFIAGKVVLSRDSLNAELHRRSMTLGLAMTVTASAFRPARVRDLTDAGMTIEQVADLLGIRDLNSITRMLMVLRNFTNIPRDRRSGKR